MSTSTSMQPATAAYVSPFTSPATPNLPKPSSTASRKLSRTHRPPRLPLSPHRLAKLANALGVSTPMPATSPSFSNTLRSSTPISSELRSASPLPGTRSTSRYLLHVVPPAHFPHDSESDADDHAAFLRGALVPLHPTLQTQLGAIAREYALPSTHGMSLYLIPGGGTVEGIEDGARPRISEEVWRWLWARVIDEQPLVHRVGLGISNNTSSSVSPEGFSALRTIPSSTPETPPQGGSSLGSYPLTPSPSTPSTTASLSSAHSHPIKTIPKRPPNPHLHSHLRQIPRVTPSPEPLSPSVSSLELDSRLLPGLGSTSIIPVLAKVEFNIERRVGAWYDTWCRSRRELYQRQRKGTGTAPLPMRKFDLKTDGGKHAVNPESDLRIEQTEEEYVRLSESPDQIDGHEDDAAQNTSRDPSEAAGYTQLADSGDQTWSDEENPEDEDDEPTTRGAHVHSDPLEEVFGTDATTWSNIQSSHVPDEHTQDYPNLALDSAALCALPDLALDRVDNDEVPGSTLGEGNLEDNETDEVMDLWNAFDRPRLSITIPDVDPLPGLPRTSVTDLTKSPPRKHVPPPLTFVTGNTLPLTISSAVPSPSLASAASEGSGTRLPYLVGGNTATPSEETSVTENQQESVALEQDEARLSVDGEDDDRYARRSPAEEKREGAVFDDLDLDLAGFDDSTEYTGDDPNDSRRSQIRMQKELDELERNLQQFSPSELKTTSELAIPDDMHISPSLRSAPPSVLTFGLAPNWSREGTPGRSASARAGNVHTHIRASSNTSPRMPALQHVPAARPSFELEEEVVAMPPVFRQPILIGTPSPVADSFVHHDQNSVASTSARGTPPGYEGSSALPAQESIKPSWPAVPFAALPKSTDEISSPKAKSPKGNGSSPPRHALNGATRNSYKSSPPERRKQSLSSSSILTASPPISVETHARIQQLEEQGDYSSGLILPPSLSRKRDDSSDISPIIPLSPDPFGRFSSSEVANTPDEARDSSYLVSPDRTSVATVTQLPQRRDSLIKHAERARDQDSPVPSSRFSVDSETVESAPRNANRSTLMSVKSIRKLWRKGNKASVTLPQPGSGKASPAIPEVEQERSREPSPMPPVPPPKSPRPQQGHASPPPTRHERSQSGLDPFYFDQESRYPTHRSPSPYNQSQSTSRAVTPSAPASLTSSPPTAPLPIEKGGNVRKSILKSWKSASASMSNSNPYPNSTSNATNDDVLPARRRRPSVLVVANNIIRGSLTSNDQASPVVPELPAEYRSSLRQSRSSGTLFSEERPRERRRPAPSSSSDSNSSPTLRTPTTGSMSTLVATSPRASEDTSTRPSFEGVSQFETVSPKLNTHGLETSFSYPQHGLDDHD